MHQHQESGTTANFEDEQEQSQAVVGTNNGTSYTPKRLSLVERFDLTNSSPPMPPQITAPIPVITPMHMPEPRPAAPPLIANPVLSPVAQEEEPPLTHKEEIDNRVKSWRAGAAAKTTLLTSTGQINLDPTSMPNTLPLDGPVGQVDNARSDMNLESYSWSITPLVPPSILGSPPSASPYHPPSVHMNRRVIKSVHPTPETPTSRKLEGYDPFSPISSEFRTLSPDLGQRVKPVSPSTTVSRGPSSGYPPSLPPESQWADYQPPAVDLGGRAEGSRTVTPNTATSWGPPEGWPSTPTMLSRVSTPDTAQQIFSFAVEIGGLAPLQATKISESPAPWNFIWPYLRLNEPDSEHRKPEPWKCVQSRPTQGASPSSPLKSRKPLVFTEHAVYPVFKICKRLSFSSFLEVRDSCIDPAVYPYFDIYPPAQGHYVDRSYPSSNIPKTLVAQTQGRTLSTSLLVLNTGSSPKVDQIGYPALNICMYLPPPVSTTLHDPTF